MNCTSRFRVIAACVLLSVAGHWSVGLAADNPQVNQQSRKMDDVIGAFDALTHHGEWLGFRNGADAPVRTDLEGDHIQGVARWEHPDPVYLFVTSAGQMQSDGTSDANLMVVKMGSRDTLGERLRSNRLLDGAQTGCTVPAAVDAVVFNYTFKNYEHPGALHLCGDILAVPLEKGRKDSGFCDGGSAHGDPCSADCDCPDDGHCIGGVYVPECGPADECCATLPSDQIQFFDVSDPTSPKRLSYTLDLDHGAGNIGLVKLPDGHFLLSVAWGLGEEVRFWRSTTTDFFDENFAFVYHDIWYPDEPTNCGDPWPVCNNTYQNASFLMQKAALPEDERLFMLCGRNENALSPWLPGDDVLALFEITGFGLGERIDIIPSRSERVVSFKGNNSADPTCTQEYGDDPTTASEITNASLLAAGNAYVSPSGELMFYAVEHNNAGPTVEDEDRSVRMAELRHRDVLRPANPKWQLGAVPGGPYSVDEGDTVDLDGSLSHPSAATPWAQLFEDTNFGGQSVMFDYADRTKDDYDNFEHLDGEPLIGICVSTDELEGLGTAMFNIKKTKDSIWPPKDADWFGDWCFLESDDQGNCWITLPDPAVAVCKAGCDGGRTACRVLCEPLCLVPNAACTACRNACDWARDECYDLCDGVEGVWFAIPDFNAPGWQIFGDLVDITTNFAEVVASVHACGRVLNLDLQAPPSPPISLDFLDPNHYDFDINDPLSFIEAVPTFVTDVTGAIPDLVTYVSDLDAYFKDLVLSLKGFNDRASSVRWYAPVGVDIVLYEKAESGSPQLVLEGTGAVKEESNLHLSSRLFDNGKDAHDRVRAMEFSGTFTAPTLNGYAWSIEQPDPPGALTLHNAATAKPTFDASLGDGPTAAVVKLVVTDTAGGSASETAPLQVLNVAPEVVIEQIEDLTGTVLVGEVPVLLEACEYTLVASHTDAGIPDTHIADVVWDDGSSNTNADAVFQFTDSLGGVTGSVRVPHTYQTKGSYTITLTVVDDDGGSTAVTQDVLVVDSAEAARLSAERLCELLEDPTLDPDAARAVRRAMVLLEGSQNDTANNGAINFFEAGLVNPALQMVQQAMLRLADAVEIDPSLMDDLEPVQRLLTLAARSSAVQAIAAAGSGAKSGGDKDKVGDALATVAQGDEQFATEDYAAAVSKYLRAYRGVQGML